MNSPLGLPEPYRAVVLRRYFEREPPGLLELTGGRPGQYGTDGVEEVGVGYVRGSGSSDDGHRDSLSDPSPQCLSDRARDQLPVNVAAISLDDCPDRLNTE